MSRPRKFRIWDKYHCSFVRSNAGTHVITDWYLEMETGRPVAYVCSISDPGCSEVMEEPEVYFSGNKLVKGSRYVVQDWVGLKTHKGEDIYEGDILEITFADYGTKLTGTVEWLQDNAAFGITYNSTILEFTEVMDHKNKIVVVGHKFKDLKENEKETRDDA